MSKPKILYIPTNSHTERVFKKETYQRILDRFDVKVNGTNNNYTTEKIAEEIKGFDGLVTGWGVPNLSEASWFFSATTSQARRRLPPSRAAGRR